MVRFWHSEPRSLLRYPVLHNNRFNFIEIMSTAKLEDMFRRHLILPDITDYKLYFIGTVNIGHQCLFVKETTQVSRCTHTYSIISIIIRSLPQLHPPQCTFRNVNTTFHILHMNTVREDKFCLGVIVLKHDTSFCFWLLLCSEVYHFASQFELFSYHRPQYREENGQLEKQVISHYRGYSPGQFSRCCSTWPGCLL